MQEYINTIKYSVNFTDKNWDSNAYKMILKNGFVVIKGVFQEEEREKLMNTFVKQLKKINKDIDKNDKENSPPMTKDGLYKLIVGNLPIVWKIRTHKNIRKIFERVYSQLNNEKITDFVSSIDGVNFRPPYNYKKTNEWAHLDQTVDGIFKCIQGQVVLNTSTAAFKVTPKSHFLYNQIINMMEIKNKNSNWLMIPKNSYTDIKNMLKNKDEFQIPIYTEGGSVILWSSSTIHSAQTHVGELKDFFPENTFDKNNKYLNWRSIIYICYRPKKDVDDSHCDNLQMVYRNNFTTNHWGDKINKGFNRFFNKTKFSKEMEELINNPDRIYSMKGLNPKLTKEVKLLLGMKL